MPDTLPAPLPVPQRPGAGRVVITGASAGVGRALALAFARRGWSLGLIAREEAALREACEEARRAGAPAALALPADVADPAAVDAAADRAVAALGGLDIWVNNAMATVVSPIAETPAAEFRRVTDVTYLGQVHGTLSALRHMRPRDSGTIVQVGSALAYRAIPLQGAYCAAKFAVRGFTDSLRTELRHEGSRIRLTMVQLPAVNTPQFEWARSRMPRRPQPVPPIHEPEPVAEAILRATLHPRRETWIGWPSLEAILGQTFAPGLADRYLARTGYEGQMTDEPLPEGRPDNLDAPVRGHHRARGRFSDRARDRVASYDPAVLRGVAGVLALATPVAAFLAGRALGRRE